MPRSSTASPGSRPAAHPGSAAGCLGTILLLAVGALGNGLLLSGLTAGPAPAGQPAWLAGAGLLMLDVLLLVLALRLRRTRAQSEAAQRDLSRTRAMFDGLNGNTVIGIYMVDEAVSFTYANPQLARMLGYDRDVLADHFPLDRVFPPDTYRQIRVRAGQRISGEVSRARYEYPALRSDGAPIDVEIYASQIILDGRPTIIGMMLDISERKRAEAAVWHQAHFDALTQLPNRPSFQDRLQSGIEASRRNGQPFALVFLDLDQFKEVNDTHGHDTGDELLQQVARRLQSCLRDTDHLARLGGDEFTLILSDPADEDAVNRICQRVLQSVAQPYSLNGQAVQISVSAGVTYFPRDGTDAGSLLKHADLALYAAKGLGRNQACAFSVSMQRDVQERRELLNDLQAAVRENQFQLMYQPVVDMRTGRTLKAEALLRWRHPVRGTVGPMDFIPLAEDSGLIVPLGDWVFRTACRQLLQWRRDLHADFVVSINVSPAQFRDSGLDPAIWIAELEALGLPGEALTVEITEQVLMEAGQGANASLLRFRDAGIQVALDDFGTGYSSLAYLQRFHVDFLKIDQCFVGTLNPESSDRILCQAMIAMAHQLGLKVIAEGIETDEQHRILEAMGCDYGQGYRYARPLTADELGARLRRESLTPRLPTPPWC